MAAGVAVDARKALVQVAAGDEALDHLSFDYPPHSARGAQFSQMALRASPQRTRGRRARAIEPAPG